MRSLEVFFHPALSTDINGVVHVAVVVGDTTAVGGGGEADRSSVASTNTVRGVSTNVECGAGSESDHLTGESADACAVCGIAVAQRRIRRGTPTNAAGNDAGAAGIDNGGKGQCRSPRDVVNTIRRDNRSKAAQAAPGN